MRPVRGDRRSSLALPGSSLSSLDVILSFCVREQKKVANDARSKLKRPRPLFDAPLRKPSRYSRSVAGKEVVLPKEDGDQARPRLPE